MSSERRTAAQLLGMDLGPKRARIAPYEDKFRDRGYPPAASTVQQLRGDFTSGVRIAAIFDVNETLTTGTMRNKDVLYAAIATMGTRLRKKSPRRRNIYASQGLTEEIAQTLGIGVKLLQSYLRSMRTEVVYTEAEGKLDPDIARILLHNAHQFVNTKKAKGNTQQWNVESVGGFYKDLYQNLGERGIRPWAPLELEFFKEYYDRRLREGSPISGYDRLVLELRRERKTIRIEAVNSIREHTGILLNVDTLREHGNAIVHPLPFSVGSAIH